MEMRDMLERGIVVSNSAKGRVCMVVTDKTRIVMNREVYYVNVFKYYKF